MKSLFGIRRETLLERMAAAAGLAAVEDNTET